LPESSLRLVIETLGWASAGVFTASYFFTRAGTLRRVQMLGAAMWLTYGVLLEARPVVVANALNLVVMIWAERRAARRAPQLAEAEPVPVPARD
jgi:hypothetical protein